jgi:serine/threonine protein kinase
MREVIEIHPTVEELRAEQLTRWQRGDRILVETLLATRSDFSDNPDAMLDLLYAEVLLREEYGESPEMQEYLHRFPHLAEPLRRVFHVHEGLASLEKKSPLPSGKGTITLAEMDRPDGPTAQPRGIVRQAGSYAIEEEVGRGGMGIVYKARHVVTGRVAALKVLRADDATEPERARFLTEARAVAALCHPNIVQIYEVFAPPPGKGTPFVALEYVGGGNLATFMGGTPLAPRDAVSLLQSLAEAMAHAHQCGIVHRDLKPANVLLVSGRVVNGESPKRAATDHSALSTHHSPLTPKITDFGLAKQLDTGAGQTRTGEVLGTPSYMAPEQASGQTSRIGPAVDVYSLGAILYEMLTGRPPFKGATILDTLAQVQLGEPVPPSQLNSAVPRDLETICLKCLQKEPAKRFRSSRELADDAARYLKGEPIQARPVGRLERALKWVKRRPAAAALLAVIGLASSVLLAMWLSFTIRLEERRQEAVTERDRAEEQARIARQQTEEARRQKERAAYLLAQRARVVDDIAVSARGQTTTGARSASAGSVLFRLASFYAKTSTTLATDRVLPAEDRRRLAEQYAQSAVRLLNCAKRAGWFDRSRQANRGVLDKDPVFATLRDRADYKKFRERLRPEKALRVKGR